MFKVQTLNNISRNGLDRLPANLYRVGNDIGDADALLVRSADMHKSPIPHSVKAVARAGAGVNNIPVAELSARGVPVFNAPGANANAVKELVVAGMLLAARNLADALGFVRDLKAEDDLHHRVEAEKKRFVGSELAGRTLGVVGLGAIGVKVANAAYALGMRVLGFDPHMTVDGAWQLSSEVAKAGSLGELFAASDYITFHVPLNDRTRGIFDARALASVRTGVVLLNFAREGIVDPAVLREGLADGRIGRYVSDFPDADRGELCGHGRRPTARFPRARQRAALGELSGNAHGPSRHRAHLRRESEPSEHDRPALACARRGRREHRADAQCIARRPRLQPDRCGYAGTGHASRRNRRD
jgi:D-3-phosphoglycerate dehydrogenase